jgi:hypothetical protein
VRGDELTAGVVEAAQGAHEAEKQAASKPGGPESPGTIG